MLPGLGELRKGLRLVDDLQTDPPVFTGRTSSNTPSANGGDRGGHRTIILEFDVPSYNTDAAQQRVRNRR